MRFNKWMLAALMGFLTIGLLSTAGATTIEYISSDDGSGRYTLEFSVANDALTEDIEWFSIYFGDTTNGLNFTSTSDYSAFSPDDWGAGAEAQPADWFSYSFEPSAIDNPGMFNSDADINGIAAGNTLTGFTVSFDWTGSGTLGDLFFEVGKFDNFGDYEWLDDGYAVNRTPDDNDPVPEPTTALLFGLGLVLSAGVSRKKS